LAGWLVNHEVAGNQTLLYVFMYICIFLYSYIMMIS